METPSRAAIFTARCAVSLLIPNSREAALTPPWGWPRPRTHTITFVTVSRAVRHVEISWTCRRSGQATTFDPVAFGRSLRDLNKAQASAAISRLTPTRLADGAKTPDGTWVGLAEVATVLRSNTLVNRIKDAWPGTVAWQALDKAAVEAAQAPLPPGLWETPADPENASSGVLVLCQDDTHAQAIILHAAGPSLSHTQEQLDAMMPRAWQALDKAAVEAAQAPLPPGVPAPKDPLVWVPLPRPTPPRRPK